MEYRRAMWDEQIDQEMVRRHERDIFPLIRLRRIFSGAENFALFDFQADGGWVDENVFAYSNRMDGHRGLILFNNCYESTSGRIRTSCAVNVGSADEPHLVQRSLTEALDLPADESHWCLFRDHVDGLEYLRNCSELAREGLHTHLRGYQYRALIDFRVVTDPEGAWSRLAAHLQGGGAADLQRARRGLEIAPAVAALRRWVRPEILAWFETLWLPEEVAEDTGEAKEPAPQTSAIETARDEPATSEQEAPAEPGSLELPDGIEPLADRLRDLPDELAALKLGPQLKRELDQLLERIPGSRILQAVYLCHGLRLLPGPWAPDRTLDIEGCRLTAGDADLLLEAVTGDLQAWTGHEYAGWACAALAGILARNAAAVEAMGRGKVGWLARLLDDSSVRTFLGVNEHQGVLWLAKEPLENLLDAMTICRLAEGLPAGPANLLDARAVILSLAAKASYRLEDFRRHLEAF
jgi:hypothetical protein